MDIEIVGIDVTFVHPQAQACIADELHHTNSLIDSGILHGCAIGLILVDQHSLFAFLLLLDVIFNGRQDFTVERGIALFGNRSYLFQQVSREPNGECFCLIFHVAILILIWLNINWLEPHFLCPKQGTRLISPVLKHGVLRRGSINAPFIFPISAYLPVATGILFHQKKL